jgi:ATP-dependent exoDNAse (exonuclease V) alpha subunit
MQSTNFQCLQDRWPKLYEYVNSAEQYVHTEPQTAILKLRCFAEQLVGILYKEFNLPCERNDSFFDKLRSSVCAEVIDENIIEKLHAIRILGNKAAHGKHVKSDGALALLHDAYLIGQWLFKTYSGSFDDEYPSYIEPIHSDVAVNILNDENKKLEVHLQSVKEELAIVQASEKLAQNQSIELQESLDEAQRQKDKVQLQNFKEASSKAASSFDLASETTRELIDLHDAFSGYDLTDGQNELVDKLASFLESKDDLVFMLKGYAGTGKTFITKGLTEYFRAVGRNFVLAAPTGKASKVIAKKTQSPAYTIHKSIYSFKDIVEYRDDNLVGSETYKFYAQLAVNDMSADTVFIVDEASMIADICHEDEFFRFGSGYLLRDFFKFVNLDHNDHNKKVIFIGDDAQLPPVGMSFSPALDKQYLYREHNIKSVSFELTEVVRQKADSGVIHNSIKLRKSLNENVFNQLIIDLGYPDVEQVSHENILDIYLESCDREINDESIMLASSNVDVAAYNRRIREYFFPNFSEITCGDKVMAASNSNAHGFFISNGDFGIIKDILSGIERRNITLRKKNAESNKIEKTVISLSFRKVIIEFKDLSGDPRSFEARIIEDLLYNDNPGFTSDENKALYQDFCIRHQQLKPNSLEFKDTLRSDPYFNALRLKFGYAITCHKAQGSEWNHVFIKCKTHHSPLTAGYFRWLYTAMTRTSNKLYLADPPVFRLGGALKPVPEPSKDTGEEIKPLNAKRESLDPVSDELFGIPPKAHFSKEILKRIKELTGESDINIQSVSRKRYLETYLFQRENEISRVDINYNGKGKITRIATPEQTELSLEIVKLVSPLEGLVIPAIPKIPAEIVFDEKFLSDLYERLHPLAEQKGITIANVESLTWVQRYTFIRSGNNAVFDVFYNGKKQFTKYAPVRNLCTSKPLFDDIQIILTEGLSQ